MRATKYALLFIGLSFVAYFLFETMGRLQLHPMQYLLVGFPNALFYLLLFSLAEHTGFGMAYILSAGASVVLIAGYRPQRARRYSGRRRDGGLADGTLSLPVPGSELSGKERYRIPQSSSISRTADPGH